MHKNYIFNKIKPVILFIYDFSCIGCGLVSLENHIHHCNGNHFDNNPFNLVPLCGHCHKTAHASKIIFRASHDPKIISMLSHLKKFL